MKTLSLYAALTTALSILFLLPSTTLAEGKTGEQLFLTMKCDKCHKTEAIPRGPTLMLIANTYGDKAKLLSFFEGELEPIVEPERAKTMKPRQRKIKKLSAEEKDRLADYIMGFKDKP